ARGIELQEAVSAGVPACSCRAGPQVGPAAERDRGRSRDLDRDAADVGAPGRRRRRPAGGADERGADGAARAAPEGADARAGTRDLEKSRGLLRVTVSLSVVLSGLAHFFAARPDPR